MSRQFGRLRAYRRVGFALPFRNWTESEQLALAARARQMDQHNFRDKLFDDGALDWVLSFSDEHFRQRYLREEGPIYCET